MTGVTPLYLHTRAYAATSNPKSKIQKFFVEKIHVIPVNDLREHEAQITCWCHPTPDDEEPNVIVHHALDERESYEEGRKPQ